MTQQTAETASTARQEQVRRAFFRGDSLHLENPTYLNSVRNLLGELLSSDVGSGDVTMAALHLVDEHTKAKIAAT